MYVPSCRSDAFPREAGWRFLAASLLVAGALIASSWLRSVDDLPGLDVAVMVASALVGGWILNPVSRVRGLPIVAGAAVSAMALGAASFGGGIFMALLLSSLAPSWTTGLAVIAILVGAEILTRLI